MDVSHKKLKSRAEYAIIHGEYIDATCPTCKKTQSVNVDDVRMVQGHSIFFWIPAALFATVAVSFLIDSEPNLWITISPVGILSLILYTMDQNVKEKTTAFNEAYLNPERQQQKEQEQIEAYWKNRKNT